jgi:hypothetical protein
MVAVFYLSGGFSNPDERLKENIKPIGKSKNGHNLYTWDWNDKAKELRGQRLQPSVFSHKRL